jgi:hypothetical protein
MVNKSIHLLLMFVVFPVPAAEFETQLQDFINTDYGLYYQTELFIGFIDNQLKYVQIQIASTMAGYKSKAVTYPVYEHFEDLKNEFNEGSPEGMNNGILI